MKMSHGYMKVDLTVQKILLAIYIISLPFSFIVYGVFMITIMTQLIIGIWQVIHALLFAISFQHKTRAYYLMAVLSYFMAVGVVSTAINEGILSESLTLFITGMVIIPAGFIIWYFIITNNYYKNTLKNDSTDSTLLYEMEGVLDGDEILKNKTQ